MNNSIELDVNKYINNQNRELFKKLSQVYDIHLYLNPELSSWCSDNNLPIIRTPKDDGNIPSFTHELLHIYLDYLGITSKVYIFENILSVNVLLSLKRLLYDHIYNVSCHKKMYPYFKGMEFDEMDFVQGNGVFFTQFDFFIICLCKRLNICSKLWTSQFIGHTFSLFNDVVGYRRSRNRRFLVQLSKLDRDLYRVLYLFDSKWSKQEDLDCKTNFKELSDGLLNWLMKNNKIKNSILL
jgi:hypothetical protein